MNNTNQLISADNKGLAAVLMEQWGQAKVARTKSTAVHNGVGKFVAAFAQAHTGDVSPNTLGAFCTDTGLPCEVRSL